MARLIPVTDRKTGRIVMMWDPPEVCPAGHGGQQLEMSWGPCPDCGHHDVQWRCRRDDCRASAVDWDHECSGDLIVGDGYVRKANRYG